MFFKYRLRVIVFESVSFFWDGFSNSSSAVGVHLFAKRQLTCAASDVFESRSLSLLPSLLVLRKFSSCSEVIVFVSGNIFFL